MSVQYFRALGLLTAAAALVVVAPTAGAEVSGSAIGPAAGSGTGQGSLGSLAGAPAATAQRVVVTVGAVGGEVRGLHVDVDEVAGYAHTAGTATVRVEHAGATSTTAVPLVAGDRQIDLTLTAAVPADSTVTVELPVTATAPVTGAVEGTVDKAVTGVATGGPASTAVGALIVNGAARLG